MTEITDFFSRNFLVQKLLKCFIWYDENLPKKQIFSGNFDLNVSPISSKVCVTFAFEFRFIRTEFYE